MKKFIMQFLMAMMIVSGAYSQKMPDNFVLVDGGTFKNTKSNYYGYGVIISSFWICKYEVTQKEWVEVMGSNPSFSNGDNLPVEKVSWYDCVEYCNKRSIKEGLNPYYNIDKNKKDPNNRNKDDDIKWIVTINAGANGYRLPTEAEWEYAAGGGQKSKSYTYSGSDDAGEAAEYEGNNKKSTKPAGGKKSNELGLYDMSGNVWEWCWDWYGDTAYNTTDPMGTFHGSYRTDRGGSWSGIERYNKSSFRDYARPDSKFNILGFRVCRNK